MHQRTDSAAYWFALKAPVDLSNHFPGPWAVRLSLKTNDIREANDKARALQAEWVDRFTSLRKADNPGRVTLSPALCAAIAAELRLFLTNSLGVR